MWKWNGWIQLNEENLMGVNLASIDGNFYELFGSLIKRSNVVDLMT